MHWYFNFSLEVNILSLSLLTYNGSSSVNTDTGGAEHQKCLTFQLLGLCRFKERIVEFGNQLVSNNSDKLINCCFIFADHC